MSKNKEKRVKLYPVKPWVRQVSVVLSAIMFFITAYPPYAMAYDVEKTLAQREAEKAAREHRTSVDKSLPVGARNQKSSQIVLKTCRGILENIKAGKDSKTELGDIAKMVEDFEKIKLKTISQMTANRANLVKRKAPEKILKRLDERRTAIVANFNEFERLMRQVVRNGSDNEALKEKTLELVKFIEEQEKKAPAGKKDKAPETLPRKHGSIRKPSRPGFSPYFTNGIQLAAAGDVISDFLTGLDGSAVSGLPVPEDLTATPEISIDSEITQLAADLDNDPVKIFEKIRNEFAYEPYFGSVKGTKRTLIEKAGNDIDLASLLMSLLRASNVSCRYVFGTIEIPVDDAKKWVGAEDPNQVAKIFTANGVPVELIEAGGKVSSLKIDHVWVKAYIDYFPYRGAVKEAGDTWIELDPSFKQNTFTDGRDIETQVGVDPHTLLTNVKANSQIDPNGNFATDVPEDYIIDELYSYAEPIRNYLAANNLTTENVFRQRKVNEEKFGILPVADQYKITARGLSFNSLPDNLRQKISFSLKDIQGGESFAYQTSLPELAEKKIILSYKPETQADERELADNAHLTNFPVYLVSLVPELRIDDQVVATGSPITMGHKQDLEIAFTNIDGDKETVVDPITAGSVNALVLDYQNTVGEILDRQKLAMDIVAEKLRNSDLTGLTKENTLGDVLHSLGISYFHQVDRFNQITAGSLEVAVTRLPSLARVAWDLNVAEQFGLPYTASVDRIKIDVDRDVYVPVAVKSADVAAENQFMFTSALTGTALEHNVLSQPFLTEAASTARAIQSANMVGDKIYTVTTANVDSVVPNLNLPSSALDDIRNAVNAGCEVTVPEKAAYINGYPYHAYIKRDIDTSDSEFVLNSIAGGEQLNDSLKAVDLVSFGDPGRYLNVVAPMVDWLNVAEEATTNAGLSYLPAITSINAWYKNRTELDPVTTIAAVIAVSGPITKVYNQPAILNVVTGEKLISPNGDGVKDAFTVQADVTRQAQWTFSLKNNQDQLVYETSGTDSKLDVTFDQTVPDGSYHYTITAQSGGASATPISGSFKTDSTAPVAELTEPEASSTVEGSLVIKGTADDFNFDHYTIQVFSPADSQTPAETLEFNDITLDASLYVLDTTKFENTSTALRLNVFDQAGNQSYSQRIVTIDNPIPDTTAPTITMSAVNTADGSTITDAATVDSGEGAIDVAINASDNVSVARIELKLDGDLIAESTDSEVLNHRVNSFLLQDGSHVLSAKAFDPSGNETSTQPLSFTLSSPISNFKVTPSLASASNSSINISAILREAAAWTLSFTGPSAIPDVTGSGNTVSGAIDASSYSDGEYTVKLTVAGITEQPELPFTIDVVEYPPVASISNVSENQVIRDGLFNLTGTADDPDVSDDVAYKVKLLDQNGYLVKDLTPAPVDVQGWRQGRVVGDSLGELDFTTVRNGTYNLKLEVKGGTQVNSTEVEFILDSQLKVGQFSFSQQDMIIPVGGQPLTVIRTYNSFNIGTDGDFGHGWTWAIKDIEMEINETRENWTDYDGTVNVRTGGGRNVDITLPDGRRTTFTYAPRQGTFCYYAEWKAAPGVKATLVPTCSNKLITLIGGLTYWEAVGPNTPIENFDFPGFVLTMRDGTQYLLEREDLGEYYMEQWDGGVIYAHAYGEGTLKRITQRSGDRIEFGDDKIDHYNPEGQKTRSVVFERNTNGKISAIHDPKNLDASGNPVGPAYITYEYDANGNLWKVNKLEDRATSKYLTTEFLYEEPGRPHFITSIKDPRGKTPMISEYDDDGRLVATVDAFGNRIELNHDLAARSETVFDRSGNPTIHGYDSRGNVVSSTDALGNTVTRTYDSNDNELTVTDALGNTTSYTYNANGDRTSVTDALGNMSNFSYDSKGNQLTSTDPLGNTTTNVYDSAGNLTSTTNALGQSTSNAYDSNGNLTSTKDALGRVTANFGYDGSGNMTSTTDAAGFARGFAYDGNGNQTGTNYTWSDPTGVLPDRTIATQTIYNDASQVTKTIDPDGNETSTVYGAIGKPTQTTDKLGNTTTTIYDDRGNVVETQYSDGTITRAVYDSNGRTFVTQDRHVPGETANGNRSIYDAIGRVVRSERLANVQINVVDTGTSIKSEFVSADSVISSSSSTYDKAGRVIKSTDAEGNITRYEYDNAGRTLAVIDALGNRTEYVYDQAGRQTLMRDALGREVTFEYDVLGRRVRTNYADGTFTSVTYNTLGQKIKETDQASLTTEFEYDELGRLAKVIKPEVADPENNDEMTKPEWTYNYDIYGRLSTITDPKGRVTQFSYDALGRQLTRTLPMGQSESQEYNNLGQLHRKVDFAGLVQEFVYDSLGRVEYKNHYYPASSSPDEQVQFIYDELGRQKQIVESRGTTTFGYDSNGRLVQVQSPEGTVNYGYDQVTVRKIKTWTANSDTRYGYDELGRLKTVSVYKRDGAVLTEPEVTTYDYTEVGSRESVTLPNGVKTQYSYNNLNRLTQVAHYNSADELMMGCEYSLAPNGRRTGVHEERKEADNTYSTTDISYSYDKLNRLVSESSVSSTQAVRSFNHSYVYDLNGNRLKKNTGTESIDYVYNSNDQLETETSNVNGGTAYVYNDNGSLIEKAGPKGLYRYTYNLQNRLATASIDRIEGTSNVQISSNYEYNLGGIRVKSSSTTTVDSGTPVNKNRIFLLDSGFTGYSQIMEEHETIGGNPVKSYVLGDDVLTQSVNGTVNHLLYDGHGSTRLLADASGSVGHRYDFDAYGIQLENQPNVTNPSATDMLYCGEQFDSELGMNYHRARYYDSDNGRWNRVDPFEGVNEDPQTLHKYAYCHANPVMGIDPSGNLTMVSMMGAVSIMATVASMYLMGVKAALTGIKSIVKESAAIDFALKVIQIYEYVEIAILVIFAVVLIAKFIANIPKIFRFFMKLFKSIPEMLRKVKGFWKPAQRGAVDLFESLRGLNLSELTKSQTGDLGEEIATRLLQENGYTDIMAIQNNSGNGIDIVARSADNAISFFEVKASKVGKIGDLSARQQSMSGFVEEILELAAEGSGRYQNISATTQDTAAHLLREMRSQGLRGYAVGVDLLNETIRLSPWR